jgi:septal ring factor EnvC (AmiA/AmiB activator)
LRKLTAKSVILLVLLMAAPAGAPYSQDKSSKEYIEAIKREGNVLDKLRREIQENEKKLKELSKKETDVVAEIHHIEKKIDLTDRLISELEADIERRQKELDGLDKEIDSVQGDLGAMQEVFYRRLRELYKRRHVHPLEVIFGSSSFSSALRRFYFLTLVASEDKRQIAEYTGLTEELGSARDDQNQKLAGIATRRDEVRKERASLVETEKKKERLHASVKKQKSEREKAIEKLRQETKRLNSVLDDLEKNRLMAVERERRGMYNLDTAIGTLRWPVEGDVVTQFGKQYNSDLGTKIISNGIDIRAQKGASVLVIAPGRVEFSDWWQSYGKMVIISHSNGYYSLYAHLARVLVQVGKDVKEGDVIGEVGDTGSLSGPSLHFEIRRGRESVDPLVYLRKK